jgi:hypothetical protein
MSMGVFHGFLSAILTIQRMFYPRLVLRRRIAK